MLKKLGIPTLAVLAIMALAGAAPAKAGVHFGIGVGGPVYTYPAPYAYSYPYTTPYPYAYPYSYSTPYVYPYGGFYYGHGGHDYDRGRFEHYDHGFRGHEGGHDGGHRR